MDTPASILVFWRDDYARAISDDKVATFKDQFIEAYYYSIYDPDPVSIE